MVLTYSTMLELGTVAPEFTLPDVVTGQPVSLADFSASKALLVMFICNHCPYVVHIKPELSRLSNDYAGGSDNALAIVAISSNDIETHPDDSPAKLKSMSQELELRFPLLFDESQKVARDYTAACTPDFFLFDKERRLVYRGQLDDSRPGNSSPLDGKDLRAAIEAVLADQPVSVEQKPSVGCNIKWKPGA